MTFHLFLFLPNVSPVCSPSCCFLLPSHLSWTWRLVVFHQSNLDSPGNRERLHSYGYNLVQQSYFCIVTGMFTFHWPGKLKPASPAESLASCVLCPEQLQALPLTQHQVSTPPQTGPAPSLHWTIGTSGLQT